MLYSSLLGIFQSELTDSQKLIIAIFLAEIRLNEIILVAVFRMVRVFLNTSFDLAAKLPVDVYRILSAS